MNDELDYFFSIKAQKLYSQIVEQFVDMIKRGEFEPGQKLPSERALSQKLNVSRTSLREALIALHMMGVVEIKPNQGTYFTTKTEGHGLGLWIAQQIATAHGGEITARNLPERGAAFTMTIPRAAKLAPNA